MNHFGIGQGVMGALEIYFRAGRRTGRTVSLVESVNNGDRIVFCDSREADRVKRLCAERGVKVECVVVDPREPQRLFERGTAQGRALFDHNWVEQFYRLAVDRAMRDIDHLAQQMSGYGEAHQETRRKAEEVAKWRVNIADRT